MQLGLIGLGRMGSGMTLRLLQGGHQVMVYDRVPEAGAALAGKGAIATGSLEDLGQKLKAPRVLWLMIPAGPPVDDAIQHLSGTLSPGDIIIDGGNSYYRDDIDRSEALQPQGIHYLDVGTSGGVFGLERGFCLMIGGEDEPVAHLDPIFAAIAPGVGAAPRTPGREGPPAQEEKGYLHCGPSGAGHFVKMVHNGIEYGIMAAYAEGLGILKAANIGKEQTGKGDAETAPLREPRYYQYDIDTAAVTEVWRRGSVVASWLLDLTAASFHEDPELSTFMGRVSDSGEGRWTAIAAVDEGVPTHVLSAALYERFASQGRADFANKVLSAMRKQFGGHAEKPAP